MNVDQTTFRKAVLDPESDQPIGLTDGSGSPAGRRFDVYRNNVAVSLTEALQTAFPVLLKLLGESNFKLLAGAFLRLHPPSSPLMMFYGQEMPDFLQTFEPTSSIGYLPDVARLELALRSAYHAADSEPMDADKLQSLPPDRLMSARLEFAPWLRLVRSKWPIYAIWQFNMNQGAPKPAMRAEDVIVIRPVLDPELGLLPAGAGTFLEAMLNGETFERAFEAASLETEAFDLSAALAQLLAAGALKDVKEDQ